MAFTFVMVLASSLLVSTGWRGSEAVYRYGLGVMSLPKVEGEGHAHEHSNNEKPSSGTHTDALSDHDSVSGHNTISEHDKNEH